jgi:hypothetical protein
MDEDEDANAVGPLVEAIRPILADKPPQIQGAVLADLLSMWLAGHGPGGGDAAAQMRELLLAEHVELVRKLVPLNEAHLLSLRSQS